jgi:biotin carboxylase
VKLDTSEALVIVSRVGYDMLVRNGALIEPLQKRKLIFINSTRTSHLPPKGTFAELHLIELRECNDYLTDLVGAIRSRHPITQILTISEQDLTPVVYARGKLGLGGLQLDKAALFRDKILMKEALKQTGLKLPQYAHAADDAAVRDLFSRFKRLVIKPRDGYGSQDTSVVSTAKEIDLFLSKPKELREGFLVENFISGDIYHLDAVVRGGEILFSSLGKYIVAPLDFSAHRWAGTCFTNAQTPLFQAAKKDLLALLKAFDTRDGVFHFEFFDTGVDRIFGEVAIRPAGGGIADAIHDTFGVHLVEEHVRVQLDMPTSIKAPVTAVLHGASLLMLSQAPGRIQGFEGLGEENYTSLKGINYHYGVGDTVAPTRYSADSLLTASLASADARALQADISNLKQRGRALLA